MPVPAANNSRAGGNQILNLAQTMCRLVTIAEPTVRVRWADRPQFLLFLDAAVLACSLLPAARDEQITMDAPDVTFDPSDGTLIPGQTAP